MLDHSRKDETNDRKLIEDARVRFRDSGIGTLRNGISTFGALVLVLWTFADEPEVPVQVRESTMIASKGN